MDIAVIGAGGDIGRKITTQLVSERVLAPYERLQLVERDDARSARGLYGFRNDIMDAYAETAPELDVALSPEDVTADIIVLVAGATMPPDLSRVVTREELAATNLPIFEAYAKAIAQHGHGHEVVAVLSNPVELAVEVFAEHLGRHRVIGLGAYTDSLRFRREIAADVGVRRQMVHAFMLGEHGDNMVPLWSGVRIYGLDDDELAEHIQRMRLGRQTANFPDDLAREKAHVIGLLRDDRTREAFEYGRQLPPDLRAAVLTIVTHLLSKTTVATASMAVDMIRTLMSGHEVVLAGQVRLDGEWEGIRTAIGAPVVVSNRGWTHVVPPEICDSERQLLLRTAGRVAARIKEWRGHA